jgi:hypothetical protein
MPRPNKPKVPLYCIVTVEKALIITRMPRVFIPWKDIRSALCKILKLHHNVKPSEILAIDGLVSLEADGSDETRMRLDRAFNGDTSLYKKFNLYAWNDLTQGFEIIREAKEG